MNGAHLQNLRYKLQKRVRRLNSAGYEVFHFSLKQFWGFLIGNPILLGVMEDLERRYPEAEVEAEKIVKENQALLFDTEIENVSTAYFVIKKCVESEEQLIEAHIGGSYNNESNFNEMLEYFKSFFLELFYEYLDEQLDDQRSILALLRRYKHKCEWFQRDKLFGLWEGDTTKGEKLLALHLYEYLHEQGIDFSIEPGSVSGKADLIAAQNSDDPLIADAKVFNPEKSKGASYIAKGFNQVYIYTLDFNETFGYLIIFKTCKEDLKFALTNQTQSTPFIIHNNKTIFIVTIDIYPHDTSASKRGILKTVEITEKTLIEFVEENRTEVAIRTEASPPNQTSL